MSRCGLRLLQVGRAEASALRDSSQHARADFFLIMESKDEIWPAEALKNLMRRARFPFDRPADAEKSSENSTGF